ncbi:MAG: hypothetical protein COA45_02195 [Zetaproteobacteria bacterium]|nr:MAG: hypothetical protein COA45_02195 [Zetaproteobacteria bacterium]
MIKALISFLKPSLPFDSNSFYFVIILISLVSFFAVLGATKASVGAHNYLEISHNGIICISGIVAVLVSVPSRFFCITLSMRHLFFLVVYSMAISGVLLIAVIPLIGTNLVSLRSYPYVYQSCFVVFAIGLLGFLVREAFSCFHIFVENRPAFKMRLSIFLLYVLLYVVSMPILYGLPLVVFFMPFF